jgi:aminopeptidase N
MRKCTTVFIFLLFISFSICSAQNNIDIEHSKLHLHFDWHKKQAKGVATIKLNVLNPTNYIRLDAGFLTINSIQLSNKTKLNFVYDGKDSSLGLLIQLDKTYAANSEIEIEIDYHTNYINQSDPNNLGGSFGKGIRFFQPTQSTPIKVKQLWSNGEPEGNRYWYPCIESQNDLRTTEFIATVDTNLTVISNGKLTETKLEGNGTKTFHYVADKPYPNFLTNIIIGEYVNVKQFYNHIPLNTFCYPDEKNAAIASANKLANIVDYFSDYTGVSYPYSSYSQVMVQDYPFPSLTGQNGVSTISDNFVDDERTHKDFLYLWDGVEAEALAAQWFGNLIAAKNWNHIWLIKAMAHFLEGKYGEKANGHDEYLMWYQNFDMVATLGDWSAGIHRPLVIENIKNLTTFLTGDNYLRSRGTLVLRLLEKEIGEKCLKRGIQYFVKHNKNKTITTQDFQNAIEHVTKRKMDWFFDQWIYKMGQPNFEVTHSYNPSQKLLQLKFIQTQKQDSSSEFQQVKYFQGKMQIEIDNRLHIINLKPIEENIFEISLPKTPKFINVNYESTWIAEINIQKKLQENLHQFENSKDVLARVNALNQLANIYKDSTTASIDIQLIYNSILKVASDKSNYWRFRMSVLSVLNTISSKPFDKEMKAILLNIIQNEKAWLKANAISVLGSENNAENADLFISQLNDSSDRVIFNAAVALGKTKSPKAFETLVPLTNKPSWKGQSKMAALTGLRFLGDERAVPVALDILKDNQSPRWFLGASGWDYPVYAATTLASFNKGNLGYEIILDRLNLALQENDINDVFSNVLLISILADPRATEIFEKLKVKYKEDTNVMTAINAYEEQFKNAIKK